MTLRSIGLLLALVVSAAIAGAQTTPNVSADQPSIDGRIYLAPLDAGSEAAFANVFGSTRYKDARPFAFLLSNLTGQNIVAVTIGWKITKDDRVSYFRSSADCMSLGVLGMSGTETNRGQPGDANAPGDIGSSFAVLPAPVAAPGERLLVTPGLIVREAVATQRKPSGGFANFPEAFLKADAVTASVDAVVLEDGEILGAKAKALVDALKADKALIDDLAARVRAAETNGEDGAALLARMARQTPSPRASEQERREHDIARRLLMSRDWRAELEKLASTQMPNFHQ